MSKLIIAEFNQLAIDSIGARPPMAMIPELAGQEVTFSTSTQSAALSSSTNFVRVISDTDCRILAGSNPTALVTSPIKLIAGNAEYFGVIPGHKIAVVAG